MEKTLKTMFEFQRFAGNPRLSRMLAEAEARCDALLDDDLLDFVSAAGTPVPDAPTQDPLRKASKY